MARDPRATLHELLTPREREVLDFLRTGLTNGEIAQRLNISADGVKYHVSQIIGKLGVRNRRQAAAWPEHPSWWLVVAGPFAAVWRRVASTQPGKLNALALSAALILFALALGGLGLLAFLLVRTDGGHDETGGATEAATCPSQPAPRFDEQGDLTFEQVAERAEQAATCPGYVLHLRSAGESDAGPYSGRNETDVWIDLTNRRGRVETTGIFTSEDVLQYYEEEGLPVPEMRHAAVYLGDVAYTRQYSGDEQSQFDRAEGDSCHGEDGSVLGLIIGCAWMEEGPLEELTFDIEQETTYRGTPALALVRSGTSRGSDETYDTTTRLYVDRATFLPLGTTNEGTLDIGEIYPVSADTPLEHTFDNADTLPADLFDPASLGYVTEDFEQEVRDADLDLPVYWLGENFSGDGGTPRLVLDSIYFFGSAEPAAEDGILPQPLLRFNYRAVNEEEDAFALTVRLYPRAIWDAHDPDARGEREIRLPEGRAVIYDYGSESGLTYRASAFIRDTVAYIAAPRNSNDQRTPIANPYDSQAAIERIVRSLTRLE